MKKWLVLVLAFYSVTSFATPDLEEIASAEHGINGPVYLYVDSLKSVENSPALFNAIIVTDTMFTIPKEHSVTLDCERRMVRVNWIQPQANDLLSLTMREVGDGAFVKPEADSAYERLVIRVCDENQ